jgi:hypothetical protein
LSEGRGEEFIADGIIVVLCEGGVTCRSNLRGGVNLMMDTEGLLNLAMVIDESNRIMMMSEL